MTSRLQIKSFVLVLVSEHSQVSEINAAVIRKLWVKKYPASVELQNSSSAILENVPRPTLPYGAPFVKVLFRPNLCHFPLIYK